MREGTTLLRWMKCGRLRRKLMVQNGLRNGGEGGAERSSTAAITSW
jgi:hypothetical protein